MTIREQAEQEPEQRAGRPIHVQERERSRTRRELQGHISDTRGVLTIGIDEVRAESGLQSGVAATLEELRHTTAEIDAFVPAATPHSSAGAALAHRGERSGNRSDVGAA